MPFVRERGKKIRHDLEDVGDDLLSGRTILYLRGSAEVYSFETVKRAKRPDGGCFSIIDGAFADGNNSGNIS